MIDPRTFREVTRSVTVSYPIPYLVACLFAVWFAAAGGSVLAAGALRWLLAGSASLVLLFALAVIGYGVFFKPNLLRSEQRTFQHRLLDILVDKSANPAASAVAGELLVSTLETRRPKKTALIAGTYGQPEGNGEHG